jgi:hypothetical protein
MHDLDDDGLGCMRGLWSCAKIYFVVLWFYCVLSCNFAKSPGALT